jgi:hypothetical protein
MLMAFACLIEALTEEENASFTVDAHGTLYRMGMSRWLKGGKLAISSSI